MSDLLLGVIIGGLIGLVGSVIQGYYALKGKKEDNLVREHLQSMQIQHGKEDQLLSRRIAERRKYLEPLSSHLSSLFKSICNYEEKLIPMIAPYLKDKREDEIRVPEVHRQEFTQELLETGSAFKEISIAGSTMFKSSGEVADVKLLKHLSAIMRLLTVFNEHDKAMRRSLVDSTTVQAFEYDFKAIMESTQGNRLAISDAQERIECLLTGVSDDDG